MSVAFHCVAFAKLGPAEPSALMMPSDRRFQTVWPLRGTYVANTWSNVRFSPMMRITCLIGVVVFLWLLLPPAGNASAFAVWACAIVGMPTAHPAPTTAQPATALIRLTAFIPFVPPLSGCCARVVTYAPPSGGAR